MALYLLDMQINSYIVCPVCSKQVKGRIKKHITEHGYLDEKSFLLDYPDCPLETDAWRLAKIKMSEKARQRFKNPEERIKTSIATKNAMARPEVRKKFEDAVCNKPLSEITRKKMSASISNALKNPEVKKKMYTPERNKKISESKKLYWKNNVDAKKKVGNTWKKVKQNNPEKWKRHLLNISHKGFEAAWGKKETSLETRYYNILSQENIIYIPQYELGGKIYDAYLPKENVLLEFDGKFWHPASIKECQYKWQIDNFYNDREKDLIAEKNNIKIVRIREETPVISIKQLLNDIYNI